MTEYLNMSELATWFKITPSRVHQLVGQGIFKKEKDGLINNKEAVQAYCKFLRENSISDVKGAMSYKEAKQRKAIAQAKLLELELKLSEGEVVKVIDVQPQWERLIQACKNKLLAVPSKATPLLVSQENLAYINDLLTDFIIEALNELSKGEEIEIVEDNQEAEPKLCEADS